MTMRWMRGVGAMLGLGLSGGLLAAACKDDWAPYVYKFPPRAVYRPCRGVCKPREVADIDGETVGPRPPVLVWMGQPSKAPSCVSVNLYHDDDFYMDWRGADGCPGCECEPLHCALPDDITYLRRSEKAVAAGDCTHATSSGDEIQLPIDWDGSCFAEPLAPLDPADTVWAEPVYEPPTCSPHYIPSDLDRFVGTLARVCTRMHVWDLCSRKGDTSNICVPPAPEGFRYCQIFNTDKDDWEPKSCPVEYPERFDVARRITGCRGCECDATEPECEMTLSRYRDASCQDLVRTDALQPYAGLPFQCLDLPGDGIVNSVSGTVVTKRDGTCESFGGEQVAEPELLEQVMLCCEPAGG